MTKDPLHDAGQRTNAEDRVWLAFRNRVENARRLADALTIASTIVPAADGSPFYSNLRFFLRSGFMIPPGASARERALYADLTRRLGEAGDLPDAEAQRIQGYLVE
jgi:hypothetical protein